MSLTLTRGANALLTAAHPDLSRVLVTMSWAVPGRGFDVDACLLLLADTGRVPSPQHVVFAGQLNPARASPATSNTSATSDTSADNEGFEIALAEVPPAVHRIVFTAAIFAAQARRQAFDQVHPVLIRVLDLDGGNELVRYPLEPDSQGETALALGELYRHHTGWKFRAVGQGWAGGLADMAAAHGAVTEPAHQVGTAPDPAPVPLSFLSRRPPRRQSPDLVRTGNTALDLSADPVRGDDQGQAPIAARTALFQDAPPVRGRVVLADDRTRVLIGGQQASAGSMHVTLTWSTMPTDAGMLAAGIQRSTDVHLGCLWEMNDRTAGVIQTFGDGSEVARCEGQTVLRLGPRSETEGQTLTVAVRHLTMLKRMVVFIYSYNGFPEWPALAPMLAVTMRDALIECRPGPAPPWATICAAASLHRVGGTLVLRRENEYLNGQQQTVAEVFGFDLPWVAGRSVATHYL